MEVRINSLRGAWRAPGRVCRMAWTCGSPGLPAFWNSTLTFWAAVAVAPTTHSWQTSATSAACPDALVTGWAQMFGKPAREMTADDPVYLAQFAGLLSSPGCTAGLPFASVSVAPPMMLLIARAATSRLSIGSYGLYG